VTVIKAAGAPLNVSNGDMVDRSEATPKQAGSVLIENEGAIFRGRGAAILESCGIQVPVGRPT